MELMSLISKMITFIALMLVGYVGSHGAGCWTTPSPARSPG